MKIYFTLLNTALLIVTSGIYISCGSSVNGETDLSSGKDAPLKLSENTVKYTDVRNMHRKSFVPVIISWELDKNITPGTPVNIRVNIKAIKNFRDATARLTFKPFMKYLQGAREKSVNIFPSGDIINLEIISELVQAGKGEVIIHFSGNYKGRKMGTTRVITIASLGYKKLKPEEEENYKKVTDTKGYTELRGRTERP